MQEPDDIVLLREYAERGSEEAFAALVTRHVNKVYSVALRHTRNPDSAGEITQAVFVILARKANQLRRHALLSGWLYQTARLASVTFVRGEIRRARRELEAHMQNLLDQNEAEVWPQIAPLLDAAMAHLNETDRHAVVLRFFDGRSMKEIAAALGANEDAAKKRVGRALEKLRAFFSKRGVDSTATAIGETISANSVQAAPVALAKTVTAVALAKGASASTSTLALIKGALKIMAWTKAKTAVAAGAALVVLTAGTATPFVIRHFQARLPDDSVIRQKVVGDWKLDSELITVGSDGGILTKLKPAGTNGVAEMLGGRWQIDHGFFIATETNADGSAADVTTNKVVRISDLEWVLQEPSQAEQTVLHRPDSFILQGTWSGHEIAANGAGLTSMIVQGANIEFRGADPHEWYKATFTLREDTNPRQLVAVITDCPAPPYVGKTSYAIYQMQNGTLTLAACEPGSGKMPTGLDDPNARKFVFTKQ